MKTRAYPRDTGRTDGRTGHYYLYRCACAGAEPLPLPLLLAAAAAAAAAATASSAAARPPPPPWSSCRCERVSAFSRQTSAAQTVGPSAPVAAV